MSATALWALAAVCLLSTEAYATPVSLSSSWAQVQPNSGNAWVCGRPALVKWSIVDGTPDDTPVAVYLMGADDRPQRLDQRVFSAGDRQVYVNLDCAALGLSGAPSGVRLAVARGEDKPVVLASTQPFTVTTMGVVSPAAGSVLSPGEAFTLKWVADGDNELGEAYLYGRAASGRPMLIATLSSHLGEAGEASLTVPSDVTDTYDKVFVRLLGGNRYVDSPDYALVPQARSVRTSGRVARQNTVSEGLAARRQNFAQGISTMLNVVKNDKQMAFNQIAGGLSHAATTVSEGVGSAVESLRNIRPVSAMADLSLGAVGGMKSLATGVVGSMVTGINTLNKAFSIAVGTILAGTEATRNGLSRGGQI